MEILIAYPDDNGKLTALKAFMKALKIQFEVEKEAPTQSIADDIREAVEEVKLYKAGKIKLQNARDLLHEL